MDDVIKSILLLLENGVKSMRCDNVLDEDKSNLAFPGWMEVQDLLSFRFGSHTRCGLVSGLDRSCQSKT